MTTNEMKKVSDEEIEKLYAFTRKHFVDYYDLQVELVDHLANAIEEKWQQWPQLSFDDALKAEFKKFGIFGFTGIVEKRQFALQKKYNKLLWGYFKEFFRLPKIMLTIALIVFVANAMHYVHPVTGGMLAFAILLYSIVRFLYSTAYIIKKSKKRAAAGCWKKQYFVVAALLLLFLYPIIFFTLYLRMNTLLQHNGLWQH